MSSANFEEKCHLSDFDHGMVISAEWASLGISETAELLGLSHTIVFMVYTGW